MAFFRNFTGPLWAVSAGNLLLLLCFLFYLVWWRVNFRPDATGGPAGSVCILAAFITGAAAIVLMCGGIDSLSQVSRGLPVKYILLGAAVLFFVSLLVTSILFHRIVTSELMIIHLWIALELSVIAVLHGAGALGLSRAAILAALVLIAFAVSIICYVLYYRLTGMASYYDGMIPLISAAFVTMVFLGITAVS
jgi:hypothetical protein